MLIIQPWLGFKCQQNPEPPALRASFGAAVADPKVIVSCFASSYLSVAVKKKYHDKAIYRRIYLGLTVPKG